MTVNEKELKQTKSTLKHHLQNNLEVSFKYSRQQVRGYIIKLKTSSLFTSSYVIIKNNGSESKFFLEYIHPTSITHTGLKEKGIGRTSIPKSIRDKLWKLYFGERFNGVCQVCGEKISINNFEAGHIVSVYKGGDDNIDNLKPICRQCNNGMGTMHMDEYKERYYGD